MGSNSKKKGKDDSKSDGKAKESTKNAKNAEEPNATAEKKRDKDDYGFEPITIALLKTDKMFVKLLKKQQKEMDIVKKRHNKERVTMQKQHCVVVEKLVTVHDKEKQTQEKALEKMMRKKGERNCEEKKS